MPYKYFRYHSGLYENAILMSDMPKLGEILEV